MTTHIVDLRLRNLPGEINILKDLMLLVLDDDFRAHQIFLKEEIELRIKTLSDYNKGIP